MKWYIKCLKQFADFRGRARREEYWMFILFNLIFSFSTVLLDNYMDTTYRDAPFGLFYFLYLLLTFIPAIAVTVRRLQDIGKSGWMFLIILIPFVGGFWMLYLMTLDSDQGENKYGQNPKDESVDVVSGSINENQELNSDVNSNSTQDLIIFLGIIWVFTSGIFYSMLPKLVTYLQTAGWHNAVHNIILGARILGALLPIFLAFAIKNKSKRMVVLIYGSVYFIYKVIVAIQVYLEFSR